jgi:hypothetical protein
MRLLHVALAAPVLAAASVFAQIPLSVYTSTFSSASATRGYYFQAPVNFVVTGLQVPDEMNAGAQVVALYRMTAPPPQYSASVPVTPVFYAAASNVDVIPVTPPVIYQQGDWVGVLGAAGTANATLRNSYGAGNYTSRVLNNPITLLRFLMQANIGNNMGVGNVSAEGTASIARVRMFVAGQGEAVTYGTGAGLNALLVSDPNPPSIGYNAGFTVRPATGTNIGGVLVIGTARANLPTPWGTLLVNPPFLTAISLPGPIPIGGLPITTMIPNDPSLSGAVLTFQAGIVDMSVVGLTNGLQWTAGK